MPRIFQFFRRKLLNENAIGKYLLYAFGEILLIVAGIFIALQINASYEDKKRQGNEISHLRELQVNLIQEVEYLNDRIERITVRLDRIDRLKVLISSEEDPPEDIGSLISATLGGQSYWPYRTAYEVLKAEGFPIENRKLKLAIADYYETQQSHLEGQVDNLSFSFRTFGIPYVRDHLYSADNPIPIDYHNPGFRKVTLTNSLHFGFLLERFRLSAENLLEKNKELTSLIDVELNGLK